MNFLYNLVLFHYKRNMLSIIFFILSLKRSRGFSTAYSIVLCKYNSPDIDECKFLSTRHSQLHEKRYSYSGKIIKHGFDLGFFLLFHICFEFRQTTGYIQRLYRKKSIYKLFPNCVWNIEDSLCIYFFTSLILFSLWRYFSSGTFLYFHFI